MFSEFKSFIARGNVLELAIAVIIGTAFGSIVTALTAGYTGSLDDYAALKKAGVPLLGFGSFLTVVLNFLIVALAVFLLVKSANRAAGMSLGAVPPTPEDVLLLREIRDELRMLHNAPSQKERS